MGNIYQSGAWATFQRSLGHEVVQASGNGWNYLAVIIGGRTWRYLYCKSGPEAESPEAFDAALADLQRTAREKRCWFVRGGPGTESMLQSGETFGESFHRRGLRRLVGQGTRTHSQEIDLTQDERALLLDMDSSNRQRHRNFHKKGVTFSCTTDPQDIEILIPFVDDVAQKRHFDRVSDDYLRRAARTLMPLGAATVYIARLHGEAIGGCLVYDWEGTRTYAHAAMDYEHRNLHAGTPLVVRMILDAKQKGLRRFDLGGVVPEDAGPEHEWHGFTRFKRSFGGRTVTYSGSWEFPVARWRYAAFPALRTTRHKWLAGRRRVVRVLKSTRSRVLTSSSGRL